MTRWPLLGLLAASGLVAQDPVHIDLSGEWKMIVLQDRPEFAQPGFDDSGWTAIRLPAGGDDLYRRGDLWLRKRVSVPPAAFERPLALTLGMIRGTYEVYFNGRLVAANGSRDSFAGIPVPSALTFPLPAGAVDQASLTIAIRIDHGLLLHRILRLPEDGPYLITDRGAASTGSDRAFEKRRAENVPLLVFAGIFVCIAALSLLAWRSEPERRELGWLSLLCFSRALVAIMLTFYLFPPAYPFNRVGTPLWQFPLQVLQQPLLGELVIAALGFRQWWLRAVVWLGWTPALASMFLGAGWWPREAVPLSPHQFSTIIVSLWASGLVIRDWLRLSRGQASLDEHALRSVLFITGLSLIERAFSEAAVTNGWLREPLIAEAFRWGPYSIERIDLFWLVVATVLIGLLLRRVAADRTERQRLAQELEAASQVQALLLSRTMPAGVDAVYLPASEVGGDFYQALERPDGSRVVLVGDVSGKGLKAAMLVSVAIGILRNEKSMSPAAILAALNDGLAGHTGGGFVTCCCAHFDASGSVTLANAGHPSPYCDGCEVAVEAGLPLGVVAGVAYEESVVRGERFTFVSDGVVEAENARRELFGFERTRAISLKPASEIAAAAKAWGQNDDITVVTVRRNFA